MGRALEQSVQPQRSAQILLVPVACLYLLLLPIEAPDFPEYFYPWLDHLQARGPFTAFAQPFANYAPPYLYFLAAFSVLPIPQLVAVKLLAMAALGWLVFAVKGLAESLQTKEPMVAGIMALCLPTVIFNGPGLGQSDSLWVAPCLLALAAAIERRFLKMSVWAGVAFAFKAQTVFVAPLLIALVIREGLWKAPFVPPAIYLIAIAPAALVGWPFDHLLTIYVRQAEAWFIGNAPNVWALPVALGYSGSFVPGFIAACAAATVYVVFVTRQNLDRESLLVVALLAAIIFPFLLPKMHERYFFLADILSFVLAYWKRDRMSITLCAAVQVGSLASIVGYLAPSPWLNVFGSLAMAAALLLTWTRLQRTAALQATFGAHA